MKTIKNLTADQIRKSILQLAIQGKLVKQDPNDEPASELVKRIYEEKHRLIKEGKIKKDKNESYIYKGEDNCYYEKVGNKVRNITEELPFDIPNNWSWIRFPSLANFRIGKTPVRNDPTQWNEPCIPWVSIGDMQDMQTIRVSKERISKEGFQKCFGGTIVPKGTLLMSFKLTIGKVSILGFDAVHNEAIISIFPYLDDGGITKDFLFHFLGLISKTSEKTDAIKGATLNKEKLDHLLLPLPPLEEQKRILIKLEEIEPYIKQYALLEAGLTNLESCLESRLKASILQYAIEGKLVRQDPNDEPASKLLARIKAEKERLKKEGQIKRDKHDSKIIQSDDKNYYENLPKGWVCAPLSNVSLLISRGKTPKYALDGSVLVLAQKCNQWDGIHLEKCLRTNEIELDRYGSQFLIQSDDIVINSTGGGTVGRTGYITDEIALNNKIVWDTHITVIRASKEMNSRYIYYFLLSPLIQNNIEAHCEGSTNQIELYPKVIKTYRLPFPSRREQDLIVKKIATLFYSI